jgi:hypothetical protein
LDQPAVPTPRLRPLSIGDILDAAFRLYRKHFLTFIGITALLQVPTTIVELFAQFQFGGQALQNWLRFAARPRVLPGQNVLDAFPIRDIATFLGISLALGAIQFLLVRNLITGALANAVARSYRGEPVSILEAYNLGWRRFLALIGASLATFVLWVVFLGLVFGCTFGSVFVLASQTGARSPASGLLAGILIAVLILGMFALLLLAMLYFYARLLVTTQAIVIEGQGAVGGIARSWRLVGGAFWRTLAIAVLMYVLTYIIAGIPSAIVSFALQLLSGNSLDAVLRNQIIVSVIAQVGQIVVLPLQLVIFTMLYYDLRVRKEGYDIELLAQQASATGT